MSWKDISDGDKTARALSARIIKSKKGTLGFEVNFEFKEISSGILERMNWVGWLTPGAIDNTMATLVDVLGYNGNDLVDEDGNLKDPNVLNWTKDVKLVVQHEEYEGKSFPRIKWVNNLGGSGFVGVDAATIKTDLASVGFQAAFLAAKQKSTFKAAPAPVSNEAIPF